MKSVIRDNCLKTIRHFNSDQLSEKSKNISENLKHELSQKSGYWLAYMNLETEPNISWGSISSHISWCFPKVVEQKLKFYTDVGSFSRSGLGVQEPLDGVECDLNRVEGAVIPGLAFDRSGVRLGRGKGFYDRSLEKYKGIKIGVCFEESFFENLPSESHDLKCDQIITDGIIFNVQRNSQHQG